MRSNMDESVDRYFSGVMSEEERSAFVASAATDDETRDLVAANRIIQRSLAAGVGAAATTRTTPNATILGYLQETHPEKSNRWIVWSFIAVFLCAITGLVYLTEQYSLHHLPQTPLSPSTHWVT